MVVDDEEFCIAAMKSLLQSAGIDTDHQVDFCINGKEALQLFQQMFSYDIHYAMIFTDFQMPIMDGITATLKIRQYMK